MAGAMKRYRMQPLGDSAVLVQVGKAIAEETFQRVSALAGCLEKWPVPGMVEFVPAFTTVTVYYDLVKASYAQVVAHLEQLLDALLLEGSDKAKVVEIPVCYGGEYGPDLEEVARHNGLSVDEVIALHSGGEYLVYMIGFAPGFPYLGGMSERIAMPRRSSPRAQIPVGSVGIAGMQTGVYPIETPGGWQLIGRTPLALFRPEENPPSLLQAGNKVRFRPISADEFAAWKEGAR